MGNRYVLSYFNLLEKILAITCLRFRTSETHRLLTTRSWFDELGEDVCFTQPFTCCKCSHAIKPDKFTEQVLIQEGFTSNMTFVKLLAACTVALLCPASQAATFPSDGCYTAYDLNHKRIYGACMGADILTACVEEAVRATDDVAQRSIMEKTLEQFKTAPELSAVVRLPCCTFSCARARTHASLSARLSACMCPMCLLPRVVHSDLEN